MVRIHHTAYSQTACARLSSDNLAATFRSLRSQTAADPELGNKGKGGGGVRGESCVLSPEKIFKIVSKNDAFLCKIFTILKMHLVNKGGGAAAPAPLESTTAVKPSLRFFNCTVMLH